MLKCIWSHLGGPHLSWSSQNFLNPHHYDRNSKLSYRAQYMLIRKLLRQIYFKCAKMVYFWCFKIIHQNKMTANAILFFVCIFSRYLKQSFINITNLFFFCQWPSNEDTMSSVLQFWIFDLTIWVFDPLGAEGTITQRRAAIFGQRVSGMAGHLIFAC